MRFFLYIAFLFISAQLTAQEWRDDLKAARKAYHNQEYSKALKQYESAQKKAPENIDLTEEIGQSAYKASEFERAEQIYQQGAASKKSNLDKSRNYHNMGNSRMQKKDYPGAIDSYKEALRNNSKDEQTRYNLSEAIRRLNDQQKKDQQKKDDKNDPSSDNKDQQNKQNEKDNSSPKAKKDSDNQNGNPSKLPNKTVERMLDKLMKDEAATKRKMGGSKENENAVNSGKDW